MVCQEEVAICLSYQDSNCMLIKIIKVAIVQVIYKINQVVSRQNFVFREMSKDIWKKICSWLEKSMILSKRKKGNMKIPLYSCAICLSW